MCRITRLGRRLLPPPPCVSLTLILAVLFTDIGHFVHDVINIEDHLHHLDLFTVHVGIELCLDFRLAHVVHPESQLDSWSTDRRKSVTIGDRLRSEAGGFAFRSAQKNDNVLRAVLLGKPFDPLLVFQVHCTSGRSDKALR